jgi:DNA-binding transcriptional MerR regulator
MRLAELSTRSGLSTPTIKYYLRLGLLHPGVSESTTWASYDESHLRRLTLVRALTDIGGLTLEAVRRVVAAVDDDTVPLHEALGTAQWQLSPVIEAESTAGSLGRVDALLDRHGWELAPDSPHRHSLAAALDVLETLDFPATDEVLDSYVTALERVARVEVERISGEDRSLAAEHVVVGTLLYEPVLLTLRRIAHEVMSGRR